MSLIGKNNAEKIWNYLMKELQNPYGVAGIMGNMKAESDLHSNNLQGSYKEELGMTDESYTDAVDDGSYENFVNDNAGYGLVQWIHPSEKQDLLNYVKKRNVSIGDLEIQLEFLCYQLKKDFKLAVWDVCASALDIREASDAVLLKFKCLEHENEEIQIIRTQLGQIFLEEFGDPQLKAQIIEQRILETELNEAVTDLTKIHSEAID